MSKSETGETSAKMHVFDGRAYNEIVTGSSLVAVQLINSSFTMSPEFFVNRDSLKLKLNSDILSCDLSEEGDIVTGIFQYEVKALSGRKNALVCRADFLAVYETPVGSEEAAAKAFCARVGLFAAYPYFRALVAHLASLGNADLPVLPVMSTGPIRSRKSDSSSIDAGGNNPSSAGD